MSSSIFIHLRIEKFQIINLHINPARRHLLMLNGTQYRVSYVTSNINELKSISCLNYHSSQYNDWAFLVMKIIFGQKNKKKLLDDFKNGKQITIFGGNYLNIPFKHRYVNILIVSLYLMFLDWLCPLNFILFQKEKKNLDSSSLDWIKVFSI